jgi:hypothetical protein
VFGVRDAEEEKLWKAEERPEAKVAPPAEDDVEKL